MATKKKGKKKVPAPPTATTTAANSESLWQANNKACQTLFAVLKLLAQIDAMSFFKPTGGRKLKVLPFLLPDASGQMVAARAHMMALQFDAMFRHFEAQYQDSTQQAAVEALAAVLAEGENTIAQLAAEADRHYLFFKEGGA